MRIEHEPEATGDPIRRITDIPRIQEALRRSARDAMRLHKRMDNPIAVWQDGQVVWIPPEEIPIDFEPEE